MKKSILLGILTVMGFGLALNPLSVKADELASEELVVVDNQSWYAHKY